MPIIGTFHFYPRSPCGERHILCVVSVQVGGFLSTLSLRRATTTIITIFIVAKFLSTLSLRRATSLNLPSSPIDKNISIHALLAESDAGTVQADYGDNISIHALLAESDARRASRQQPAGISIHALLAESDYYFACPFSQNYYFYPRSPCGERQFYLTLEGHKKQISIHALLAESDQGNQLQTSGNRHFYPRSPCGERRIGLVFMWWGVRFLSTLSLRRATIQTLIQAMERLFLSTLSLRRATSLGLLGWLRVLISIHALLAESDACILTITICTV